MIKIGLTGGIGSGKSTVSKIFRILDVPVYDADSRAKKLVADDVETRREIELTFGKAVFKDGVLQNKVLANIVFNNPSKLEKLNNIIHPRVEKDFTDWSKKQKSAPYIVKEAAILFESGSYKGMDKILMVYSPEPTRIERVMKRDNISRKIVLERIRNQWSDELKKEKSNYIIYNDEKQLLIPQVLKIHTLFSSAGF
jgi:dephospho-CoA kinase